jgi:hypothetical protein
MAIGSGAVQSIDRRRNERGAGADSASSTGLLVDSAIGAMGTTLNRFQLPKIAL